MSSTSPTKPSQTLNCLDWLGLYVWHTTLLMNGVQTLQRCTQRPRVRPTAQKWSLENRGLRIHLPCPNHTGADPDMDHTVTISSVSLCERWTRGRCWSPTHIMASGGRGHSVPASHLNRRHMKRDIKYRSDVSIPPAHIYIHTSLHITKWVCGGVRESQDSKDSCSL